MSEKTLMSPMAFTTNGASKSTSGGDGGSAGSAVRLTPLTVEQLTQAVSHLLETDPDFVDKIHRAYVDSLTRKLL